MTASNKKKRQGIIREADDSIIPNIKRSIKRSYNKIISKYKS